MDISGNPVSIDELLRSVSELSERPENGLTPTQILQVLDGLPKLAEKHLKELGHQDGTCPICFTSLLALLSEEETAIAMDSPAHPVEELGVTRLDGEGQCGHVFCRRDLVRWVRDGHNSCPLCRRKLLQQTGGASTRGNENTGSSQTMADRFLRLLVNEVSPFGVDVDFSMLNEESSDGNSRNDYSSMYS